MKWYDLFSTFYDFCIDPIYNNARKKAIEQLELKPSDIVLDLACGTGPNFKYIVPKVGNSGLVIGLDFSKGMLEKANKKVKRNNWKNVVLIEQDASKVTKEEIQLAMAKKAEINSIICFLALSVTPNWEDILKNIFALLAPGGSLIIVDVYADKRVLQTWLVEKIARADVSRKSWVLLEELSDDFSIDHISKASWLHGGLLFLARGKKK